MYGLEKNSSVSNLVDDLFQQLMFPSHFSLLLTGNIESGSSLSVCGSLWPASHCSAVELYCH